MIILEIAVAIVLAWIIGAVGLCGLMRWKP
jgi:hypothetical protein